MESLIVRPSKKSATMLIVILVIMLCFFAWKVALLFGRPPVNIGSMGMVGIGLFGCAVACIGVTLNTWATKGIIALHGDTLILRRPFPLPKFATSLNGLSVARSEDHKTLNLSANRAYFPIKLNASMLNDQDVEQLLQKF